MLRGQLAVDIARGCVVKIGAEQVYQGLLEVAPVDPDLQRVLIAGVVAGVELLSARAVVALSPGHREPATELEIGDRRRHIKAPESD